MHLWFLFPWLGLGDLDVRVEHLKSSCEGELDTSGGSGVRVSIK